MLARIKTSSTEREADQKLMRRFFADASHLAAGHCRSCHGREFRR
jgi:hypothetical protein